MHRLNVQVTAGGRQTVPGGWVHARIYQVLTREWLTIPERGVVTSRQRFKFCWAPTIFLAQLKL